MNNAPSNVELLTLAAQIVSAHVAHNAVPVDTLSRVIQSVYATLSGLESAPPLAEAPAQPAKRGAAGGAGRPSRRRAATDATTAKTPGGLVAKAARRKSSAIGPEA